MGWNATTKIMTAPVSIDDISDAVAYAHGDLGVLIRSGSVNKWAKYKPVNANKVTKLTENERAAAHQGFTYNDVVSDRKSYYHSDPTAAFNTAKAMQVNGVVDWEYLHNNFPWYRMLDFVPYDPQSVTPYAGTGYNAAAGRPFSKVAFGQAPNSPAGTWWFQFTFHYLQYPGGIALTDLGAVKNQQMGGWYWGVLYKDNYGGSITFAWLTTTAGGSTKIPIGVPPQLYISGYIEMPQVVGATQLEAYLCAACKSSVTDSPVGYVHLPIENASCEITNPSGNLHFYPTAYQDPRQVQAGLTRKPGYFISHRTIAGVGSAIVNESGAETKVRVLLGGISEFASDKSGIWNIRVWVKITGDAGVYRENYTDYSLNCSNPPAVAYIDVSPFGSSTLPLYVSDGPGTAKIVLQVQVGSEPAFYVNPATSEVKNNEAQATVNLSDIYDMNLGPALYCELYDADNDTYDPAPYPPSV